MINLQYTQFIMKMDVVDSIIDHGTNVLMPSRPEHFEDGGQGGIRSWQSLERK